MARKYFRSPTQNGGFCNFSCFFVFPALGGFCALYDGKMILNMQCSDEALQPTALAFIARSGTRSARLFERSQSSNSSTICARPAPCRMARKQQTHWEPQKMTAQNKLTHCWHWIFLRCISMELNSPNRYQMDFYDVGWAPNSVARDAKETTAMAKVMGFVPTCVLPMLRHTRGSWRTAKVEEEKKGLPIHPCDSFTALMILASIQKPRPNHSHLVGHQQPQTAIPFTSNIPVLKLHARQTDKQSDKQTDTQTDRHRRDRQT